jgi:uncharacterized protein (TIGR02118 family)
MIKSLSLLTRKGAMSREEFRRIWVGEHAPLVHAVPQVRRYVLSFVLEEPTRPDVPTQAMDVDAIAELWYDDMAALKAAMASAEMKAVQANGALHLGAIKTFLTEEMSPSALSQRTAVRKASTVCATSRGPCMAETRPPGAPMMSTPLASRAMRRR